MMRRQYRGKCCWPNHLFVSSIIIVALDVLHKRKKPKKLRSEKSCRRKIHFPRFLSFTDFEEVQQQQMKQQQQQLAKGNNNGNPWQEQFAQWNLNN